jgi:hypothetical protein
MIYLFHNIYGDADDLIATKPTDCEAIPFGWTPEAEAYRNEKIAQLKCVVSSLPSVIYFQPEYTLTVNNQTNGETNVYSLGNCWNEVRVHEMPKPWNWTDIQAEINRDKTEVKTVSGDPA